MAEEGMARTWYSVTVVTEKSAEYAVETAFGVLDSLGTEIDTLGKSDNTTVSVVGYFDKTLNAEGVRAVLDSALAAHGCDSNSIHGVKFDSVVEKDWLEEWKKHWKPTAAGRFVIAPPWDRTAFDDKFVIFIEPAMAFGTGTHETTRLCLEMISEHFSPEMSFLDVGTGTGILSIAAAKLASGSPGRFLALDTDEHSVEVAAENAVLNDVSTIEFSAGSIGPDTPEFDFVCANMTIDIINPMLPLLVSKTRQFLILSGILNEQETEITSALSGIGIEDSRVSRMGEWIALTLKLQNTKGTKDCL